jgi:hypothetical protein
MSVENLKQHSCGGNSCHDYNCVDCHPLEHCINHDHYMNEEKDCECCPDFRNCVCTIIYKEQLEFEIKQLQKELDYKIKDKERRFGAK